MAPHRAAARGHRPCARVAALRIGGPTEAGFRLRGPGRVAPGKPWGELEILDREEALSGTRPIPGETVALVTGGPVAEGIETAQVMLLCAGRPLRAVLAHGCAPRDEVTVINALARRLDARVVVLAASPAYAASGWLAQAEAALDGHRALALETGAGEAGAWRAVAFERAWASRRLGGPILRPEFRTRLAAVELLDAARAEGGLARAPAAVLLDLDPPDARSLDAGDVARLGCPTALPAGRPVAVDVAEIDAGRPELLDPGDPETPVVVLPCIDPERGRAAAARLARRAGAKARIVIALDTRRLGFVATLNAVASRLGAGRLAYVAEDAFPGRDWLARGLAALDAPGVALVGFNCGKWDGRVAAFGCLRLDWARTLYGGPVMHPGYRSHRADNELTAIARAQGAYAYEPSALVIERDPRKAGRGRERDAPNFDPADRRLFRRRFATAFDGRAPRGPLAELAGDYLGPRHAAAARAALEAAEG